MTEDVPPELREFAERQCGVISRRQLRSAGLTDGTTAARLRRGHWQRLQPGVYAVFSGTPSREAMVWAAVLYAGPGALLSHQTAAEIAGLTDRAADAIHVTVPAERRVIRRPGIVVHLSARAAQAAHPARLPPQSRIEETVLDLWQSARNLDEAIAWLAGAVGRRLTTPEKLRRAVAARARIRWRRQLAELLSPDAAGQHSILEHRYVRDVERPHRLPTATRQAYARRNGRSEYRDTLYEEYGTAVELDGRVAHPGQSRWQDIRRDNAAAVTGIVTLRYGWREVTTAPCQVAAEVAAVLTGRGYRNARPCSAACPVRPGEQGRQPAQPAPEGQLSPSARQSPGSQSRREGQHRPSARRAAGSSFISTRKGGTEHSVPPFLSAQAVSSACAREPVQAVGLGCVQGG